MMQPNNNRDIKEISFAELFENSFYVIPYYQRSYSWDKDNLTSLWEDIEHIHDSKNRVDGPGSHFMSSVLIKASSEEGKRTYHIVDGQQRITTIYLALKAAQDVIESSSKYRSVYAGARLSERLQDLLYGKNYNYDIREQDLTADATMEFSNPRLTLGGQSDDHAFNILIYKGATSWNATHTKSKVAYTYQFFVKKFTALINGEHPTKFFEIVNVIMASLQMIYITILEHEAPQKIFESVNGLTKKLYAGELIKNYLLMSLTNEENSNRLYQKYWAEFDKPEWIETDKDKERLTKILYYWVCSRGFKAQRATDEHVYRAFKQDAALSSLNASDAAKKAETLSESLHKSITTLMQLAEAKNHPRTRLEKSYSRIYAVKDTTNSKSAFILFIQLIDGLERHYGHKMTELQLDKLLLPLESYIIRKVLSAYGYSGRTSEHLVDLSNKVFTSGSFKDYKTIDEYLESKVKEFAKELASGIERNRRFDSNAALFDSIVGSIEKGIPPRQITANYHDIIKMLLIQVENHLRTNSFNPNGSDMDGDVSVEHWLPQHSNPAEWPLNDEKDRALYTNALGNLCIIPPRINSSLSNQSLANKVKKVVSILKQDKSEKTGIQTFDKVLELCQIESDSTTFRWNEVQMEERAKWIMSIVLDNIFKDVESFTGEERPNTSESFELWDTPVAGRRIVAKARQTTVRAYQKSDGTFIIDEVINMLPNHTDSFKSKAQIKKRAEYLRQAKKQESGSYDWRGAAHSQNRTGLLSVFIGSLLSDIWEVEKLSEGDKKLF